MKIEKIVIHNLKNICNKEVVLDKSISYITGTNGTGKTSILTAINYLLTGNIENDYIGPVDDKLSVEGIINSKIFYRERKIDKNGRAVNTLKIDGNKVSVGEFNEYINAEAGTEINENNLAFSSEIMQSISSKDLGSFLNKYIPKKITKTDLINVLNPDSEEMTVLNSICVSDEYDIDSLKGLYDLLYVKRRDNKKQVTTLKSSIKELVEPEMDLEKIKNNFDILNNLKTESQVYEKTLKTYQDSLKKKEQDEKRIDELKEELKKYQDIKNVTDMKEKAEQYKESLQQKYIDSNSILNTLTNNKTVFEKQINLLNTDTCPLSTKIKCTSIAEKQKAKEEINIEIEKNEIAIKKQNEILTSISEEIKKLKIVFDKIREIEEKQKIVENIKMQIKVLSENKVKTEEPKKPKILITKEQYDLKYQELTEKQKIILEYEENEKIKKIFEKEEKTYNVLDVLVKKLDPKGSIFAKLVNVYMQVFNDTCDNTIKEMGLDMKIKFVPQNGISIIVKNKNNYMTYNSLSEGEKVMVSFIIMDMINQLTGVNIIIFDSLEKLDKENYKKFISTIIKYKDKYDNIFISIVNHENPKDFVIYGDNDLKKSLLDNTNLVTM